MLNEKLLALKKLLALEDKRVFTLALVAFLLLTVPLTVWALLNVPKLLGYASFYPAGPGKGFFPPTPTPTPTPSVPTESVISENTDLGHITVENQNIKAVFHYKTIASQNYNQGGGNLYELYDKKTDPATTNNLIAVYNGGTGNTHHQGIGVGGVGSTGMYAVAEQPPEDSPSQNMRYVADNNLSARYVTHSVTQSSQSGVEIFFHFIVSDLGTDTDWYEIKKTWQIEPGGKIHLAHDWTLLRSGWLAEVAARNQWSWDRGWTTLAKRGHDWGDPACDYSIQSNGYECEKNYWKYISIGGAISNCWNEENRFHAQDVVLKGSPTAPEVILRTDNKGPDGKNWGFEGGGLWKINRIITNQTAADSIFEQCTYNRRDIGDGDAATHTSWFSWWGGETPTPDRYRYADLTTQPELRHWQDSYIIELSVSSLSPTPISSPTSPVTPTPSKAPGICPEGSVCTTSLYCSQIRGTVVGYCQGQAIFGRSQICCQGR